MEQSSIPVPSPVPSRSNAPYNGTNPFTLVDIGREISEFLDIAKARYSKKTYESRIKVYAKYLKLLAIPSLLANELNKLGRHAVLHFMKVASAFAKFLDAKYGSEEFSKAFQRLRKMMGLKWYVQPSMPRISSMSPEDVIIPIISNIGSTKHRLFAMFMLATGLRTSEALDAWENFFKYYKEINGIHILEIMSDRRTKKTYFAFLTPDLANTLKSLLQFKTFSRIDDSKVWTSWKEAAQKVGYDHRVYPIYYLRKVHATLLRRVLDADMVDLMQGRAPKRVLDQYYNVESLRYLYKKYLEAVGPLISKLLKGYSK